MVRSAAKQRVSNHEAPSFETHRFAMLLRMRRIGLQWQWVPTFADDDQERVIAGLGQVIQIGTRSANLGEVAGTNPAMTG